MRECHHLNITLLNCTLGHLNSKNKKKLGAMAVAILRTKMNPCGGFALQHTTDQTMRFLNGMAACLVLSDDRLRVSTPLV